MKKQYGKLPISLGIHKAKVQEMFFYQYLPIKLSGDIQPIYESRLKVFDMIIGTISCDFIGRFGLNKYKDSYMYITAKHLFQNPNCEFNRHGYHSDGFMTDDINYIWCNNTPTIFSNCGSVELTQDCNISMDEMKVICTPEKEVVYEPYELLMLDELVLHKVASIKNPGMRAFLKASFSTEKYNLIGNSNNDLLSYSWDMKERQIERNHPISKV